MSDNCMGSPLDRAAQRERMRAALNEWGAIGAAGLRVLVIGPDITRVDSGAGELAGDVDELLGDRATVDLLPALGTHLPMTGAELTRMYPAFAPERVIAHDWRHDTVRLGEIPPARVAELSGGRMQMPIAVELNRRVVEGDYDLIVSIGQVVPHEVAGMANHAKNLLVGAGGKDMLDKSHFLGAVCGIEAILGRADNPVRRLFDEAFTTCLAHLPIRFVQTVVAPDSAGVPRMQGLFCGAGRAPFEQAARLAAQLNITHVEKPIHKCIVYLEADRFRSTWLGNKAIYRTRMALADGAELIVLGPGVGEFGEDAGIDRLIRRHGYRGIARTLAAVQADAELEANLAAAAHLIHGSTEGRFRVTWAAGGLTREAIESVGYGWGDVVELARRYAPADLRPGWNAIGGERIYFIPEPGLGLWTADRTRP